MSGSDAETGSGVPSLEINDVMPYCKDWNRKPELPNKFRLIPSNYTLTMRHFARNGKPIYQINNQVKRGSLLTSIKQITSWRSKRSHSTALGVGLTQSRKKAKAGAAKRKAELTVNISSSQRLNPTGRHLKVVNPFHVSLFDDVDIKNTQDLEMNAVGVAKKLVHLESYIMHPALSIRFPGVYWVVAIKQGILNGMLNSTSQQSIEHHLPAFLENHKNNSSLIIDIYLGKSIDGDLSSYHDKVLNDTIYSHIDEGSRAWCVGSILSQEGDVFERTNATKFLEAYIVAVILLIPMLRVHQLGISYQPLNKLPVKRVLAEMPIKYRLEVIILAIVKSKTLFCLDSNCDCNHTMNWNMVPDSLRQSAIGLLSVFHVNEEITEDAFPTEGAFLWSMFYKIDPLDVYELRRTAIAIPVLSDEEKSELFQVFAFQKDGLSAVCALNNVLQANVFTETSLMSMAQASGQTMKEEIMKRLPEKEKSNKRMAADIEALTLALNSKGFDMISLNSSQRVGVFCRMHFVDQEQYMIYLNGDWFAVLKKNGHFVSLNSLIKVQSVVPDIREFLRKILKPMLKSVKDGAVFAIVKSENLILDDQSTSNEKRQESQQELIEEFNEIGLLSQYMERHPDRITPSILRLPTTNDDPGNEPHFLRIRNLHPFLMEEFSVIGKLKGIRKMNWFGKDRLTLIFEDQGDTIEMKLHGELVEMYYSVLKEGTMYEINNPAVITRRSGHSKYELAWADPLIFDTSINELGSSNCYTILKNNLSSFPCGTRISVIGLITYCGPEISVFRNGKMFKKRKLQMIDIEQNKICIVAWGRLDILYNLQTPVVMLCDVLKVVPYFERKQLVIDSWSFLTPNPAHPMTARLRNLMHPVYP